MKNLMLSRLTSLSVVFVLLGTNALLADSNERSHRGPSHERDQSSRPQLANLYVFGELGGEMLGLINIETDQLIQVDLMSLDGWPRESTNQGQAMQHAWVTPNGKTIYFSLDAAEPNPAAVVVLGVEKLNWDNKTADLVIQEVLPLEQSGTPSVYPSVEETDPSQPIATWTQGPSTQAHGPTFQPYSPFTYFTQWTDNRIRVINRQTNQLLEPLIFGNQSQQTHGVNFNPSGKLALGTGYYYDSNEIDVYRAKRRVKGRKGPLKYVRSIRLGNDEAYAAFTHYTYWLNNHYALTASMQLGPTSLSPQSAKIIGPSVWLLDVRKGLAEPIIGTAANADDAGIYRSASDLVVAGYKLYVAEEDSIDGSFGDDGYVSVFDISNIRQPRFLKQLKPGQELPQDFVIAHGLNVTVDERFVYVASYASNYIIKIDTETDEVVKIFGSNDGITAPHGGFIAGQFR